MGRGKIIINKKKKLKCEGKKEVYSSKEGVLKSKTKHCDRCDNNTTTTNHHWSIRENYTKRTYAT